MSDDVTRQEQDSGSVTGLLYMAGSALFFSVMSVLVKEAGQSLPSQQVVLFRSAALLGLAFGHIRWAGVEPWGTNRPLLLLRGVVGFAALSCFYYALTHLPLPDATLIQYTNPIWTALLAAFFLGEAVKSIEIGGLVASLVGVVLIQQPAFLFVSGGEARLPAAAVAVALGGALFSATAYVIVRKLRETEHPLVVVFYFSLVATPAAVATSATLLQWPTPREWVLLVGVGLTTYTAQVMLTKGLHLEKAGRATAISYLQIVFAFGWGITLFDEYPNALSVSGAVLIVGSALLIALKSRNS